MNVVLKKSIMELDNNQTEIFIALSHPTRLAILDLLRGGGTVFDLVDEACNTLQTRS